VQDVIDIFLTNTMMTFSNEWWHGECYSAERAIHAYPSHSSSRENEVAEATVAVEREKVRIRRKFIYSSRQKIPVPEP
jgi:hypothetical protein